MLAVVTDESGKVFIEKYQEDGSNNIAESGCIPSKKGNGLALAFNRKAVCHKDRSSPRPKNGVRGATRLPLILHRLAGQIAFPKTTVYETKVRASCTPVSAG